MDNSNNILNSMYQYHQNIHEYNENMRRFLYLLEDDRQHTNTANRREYSYYNTAPRTSSAIPIINTFMRNYLQNRDDTNVLRYNFEDVVVRPTAAQIHRATETIVCNESHSVYTVCPITLEPFTVGEEMCQIRHCSHIFKKTALMNWFSRNVRCPVCRYDIRNYTRRENEPIVHNEENEIVDDDDNDTVEEPNDDANENETSEFDDIIQELNAESSNRNNRSSSSRSTRTRRSNPILSSLTSAIRSFVQNEVQNLPSHLNSAAELLYTFDIPITFDVSGNEY